MIRREALWAPYTLPRFNRAEIRAIEEALRPWVEANEFLNRDKGSDKKQKNTFPNKDAETVLKEHGIAWSYKRVNADGDEVRFSHVEIELRVRAARIIFGEVEAPWRAGGDDDDDDDGPGTPVRLPLLQLEMWNPMRLYETVRKPQVTLKKSGELEEKNKSVRWNEVDEDGIRTLLLERYTPDMIDYFLLRFERGASVDIGWGYARQTRSSLADGVTETA